MAKKTTTSKKTPKAKKYRVSTKVKQKAMVAAMKSTLGNVSASIEAMVKAAKGDSRYAITRTTHYEWMKTDPDYKKAIEDVVEGQKDFVEAALFRNIKDGREASTIFYLKTKARDRGYIEVNANLNRDVSDNDLENMEESELKKILSREV